MVPFSRNVVLSGPSFSSNVVLKARMLSVRAVYVLKPLRALEFANKVLRYRDVLSEGDVWPTDAPGVYSADFMYGAAGIGHFLLRLETQAEPPMPLIGRNVPGDCPND